MWKICAFPQIAHYRELLNGDAFTVNLKLNDRLDASSTFDVREFVVEGIDELKTPLGVNAAALYGKRRYK